MMASNDHFEFGNGTTPILSSFSALHFFRNYNQLFIPNQDLNARCLGIGNINDRFSHNSSLFARGTENIPTNSGNLLLPSSSIFSSHGVMGCTPLAQICSFDKKAGALLPRPLSSAGSISLISNSSKRQRGEKKPIPDEQKDDKYFERRKRNNQAAKKSRDARKIREDQVALRATMLEHENAILRAQIVTLREEAASLRQLLLVKKSTENHTHELQICSQ